MARDLVGDLVALEHVLERGDPDAELLGGAHHLQDLVLAVGVAVDLPLALEDLGDRLELQIGLGRMGGACLLDGRGLAVLLLPAAVVARRLEASRISSATPMRVRG